MGQHDILLGSGSVQDKSQHSRATLEKHFITVVRRDNRGDTAVRRLYRRRATAQKYNKSQVESIETLLFSKQNIKQKMIS